MRSRLLELRSRRAPFLILHNPAFDISCGADGIFVVTLVVLGTSFFRRRLPYKVFYAFHMLVFAMCVHRKCPGLAAPPPQLQTTSG